MTCTVSADPYEVAKGMDAEQQALMKQMVDIAKKKAQLTAQTNGYGPNRTDAFVNNEMLKARNEAHDRFLLEQIKAGLVDRAHAKAHNLDLNKLGV